MSDVDTLSGSLPILILSGTLFYLVSKFQKRGEKLFSDVVNYLETSRNRTLYESEVELTVSAIKKWEVQEEANLAFANLLFLVFWFRIILVPGLINHAELYDLFAAAIILFGLIVYTLKLIAHEILKPRLGTSICMGLIILFLESILSIVLVYFY